MSKPLTSIENGSVAPPGPPFGSALFEVPEDEPDEVGGDGISSDIQLVRLSPRRSPMESSEKESNEKNGNLLIFGLSDGAETP